MRGRGCRGDGVSGRSVGSGGSTGRRGDGACGVTGGEGKRQRKEPKAAVVQKRVRFEVPTNEAKRQHI